MKVENHNDLGNPYHDDRTGQFSSSNGGKNPLYRKKNAPLENIMVKPLPFRNDKGQKMNIKPNQASKDLKRDGISFDEIKMLKEHGLYDDYKQKYGSGTQNSPDKIDPSLINQNQSTLENNMNRSDFGEALNKLSNSAFMKTLRFVISGFDFNKFKRVNEKVIKPKQKVQKPIVSPEKQMEEEKKNLRNEGMNLLNNYKKKVDNINLKIEEIQKMKNDYEKKFGNSKKMFEKWWNKSNLRKSLIKNQVAQQQAALDFETQKRIYKKKLEKSQMKENKMKGIE